MSNLLNNHRHTHDNDSFTANSHDVRCKRKRIKEKTTEINTSKCNWILWHQVKALTSIQSIYTFQSELKLNWCVSEWNAFTHQKLKRIAKRVLLIFYQPSSEMVISFLKSTTTIFFYYFVVGYAYVATSKYDK